MNIFDSQNFGGIMFVAISLVLLLIGFNLVNIVGEGITGYAVSELVNNETEKEIVLEEESMQGELYTERSYFIYYMIIVFLGFGVTAVAVGYFLPWIKKMS